MIIPTTTVSGNFIISAQGSSGPSIVAILSKAYDSAVGEVAVLTASNDASGNFYDISWPANSRPVISCTATTQTKLFISNGSATNIAINAAGAFSTRSSFDSRPDGFTFYDDTNKCFYMRKTGTSGVWTDAIYFPSKSDGEQSAVQVITSTPTDIVFTETSGNFIIFVKIVNGASGVYAMSKGIVSSVGDVLPLSASPDGSNNYLTLNWPVDSKPVISFNSTVTASINVYSTGYHPPTRDEVIKYVWAFVD
jgi:hypothetical protein